MNENKFILFDIKRNRIISISVAIFILLVIIILIYMYIQNNKKENLKNPNLNIINDIKNITREKILHYDKIVKLFGKLSKNTGGGGPEDKSYQGIYFMDTGEKIKGQRDPNKRIDLIKKYISFKNKSILDLGCNSGEILFNLIKYDIKFGIGLDFDPYKINMCNIMKRYNKINNLDFFVYDLKNESIKTVMSFLPDDNMTVDIVFLFAVCQAWIYPCNYLINNIFTICNTLVIEINGNDDKKIELIEYLKKLYNTVKEITDINYCNDCVGRRLFIATDKKNIVFGGRGIAGIEMHDNKVKKFYSDKSNFEKEKNWLTILQKFDFTPKIYNIDHKNMSIEMENCGMPFDVNNKPMNFDKNFKRLQKTLNDNKIYHNDIHKNNLLVRPDNSLCLIDFDWMSNIKSDPYIIKNGPHKKESNNEFLN